MRRQIGDKLLWPWRHLTMLGSPDECLPLRPVERRRLHTEPSHRNDDHIHIRGRTSAAIRATRSKDADGFRFNLNGMNQTVTTAASWRREYYVDHGSSVSKFAFVCGCIDHYGHLINAWGHRQSCDRLGALCVWPTFAPEERKTGHSLFE